MSICVPFTANGAPEASVIVHNPWGASSLPVTMQIDTGASHTGVPQAILNSLNVLRYVDIGRFAVFDGTDRMVRLYEVAIELHGTLHRGVRVMGIPGEEAILGRDILGDHTFLFDGPGRTFHCTG